jgi:glutamine amidotransferase
MAKEILIVDYGMGNLHSVANAVREIGHHPVISANPSDVLSADYIILPGVGSFRSAMSRLEQSGLKDALSIFLSEKQRPLLGICLGMQLLAASGAEDGGCEGLRVFEGTIARFSSNFPEKIPHVGFNTVLCDSDSLLFAGLPSETDFYFVHSFRLGESPPIGISSKCQYGESFVASWEYNNVFATQFHPEKSQANGLKLLMNFTSQ